MGFGDIIPAGWEEHHRTILDSSMTAVCDIMTPGDGYDYTTGEEHAGTVLAERVACRVQQLGASRGGIIAPQVDLRDYQITMNINDVPHLNIRDNGPYLIVTGYKEGHAGDPHLVGKSLRITNQQHGSLLWERVLYATVEAGDTQ